MRAQLLHLSGPFRGRTDTYTSDRVLLGTSPEADVRFLAGGRVVERHAEIVFKPDGCSFYLNALDGPIFVNRAEVREIILATGDLLEIGLDGPKLRFRAYHEPGRPCKPVRQMLRDAREVGRESGLAASAGALRHDLVTQSTWKLKLGSPLAAVVLVVAAAYLGGVLGGTTAMHREEADRQVRADLHQREVDALLGQVQEFRRRQAGHASREEVAELRADLARRAVVVDDIVRRNDALKRVLDVYSKGVCLIHGVYTFMTMRDDQLVPVTDTAGNPLEIEYIGSGFLASDVGQVITNRHVAQPWWNNEGVRGLLEQGLVPRFVHLTAGFPGKEPVDISPDSIRLSDEGVDLAVLHVEVTDVPVLPLGFDRLEAARGGRVILLGYPTGLNAILARAEPDLVAEVMAAATDTTTLIAELARRGAISPVITQGALNEVRPRRLVYDAETTSGGSGGPVFGSGGRVIGVNFAITRDFDGSNFGVPITFARRLLGEP